MLISIVFFVDKDSLRNEEPENFNYSTEAFLRNNKFIHKELSKTCIYPYFKTVGIDLKASLAFLYEYSLISGVGFTFEDVELVDNTISEKSVVINLITKLHRLCDKFHVNLDRDFTKVNHSNFRELTSKSCKQFMNGTQYNTKQQLMFSCIHSLLYGDINKVTVLISLEELIESINKGKNIL